MMEVPKTLGIFERLNVLFTKELKHILNRELHNKNRLYLYSLGDYWAAFEKSAYLLDRMSSEKKELSVLHLNDYPFPVLMCSVHNQKVKELSINHLVASKHLDSMQLLSHTIDPMHYNDWYKSHVEDDME